jgi:hypothetical protein
VSTLFLSRSKKMDLIRKLATPSLHFASLCQGKEECAHTHTPDPPENPTLNMIWSANSIKVYVISLDSCLCRLVRRKTVVDLVEIINIKRNFERFFAARSPQQKNVAYTYRPRNFPSFQILSRKSNKIAATWKRC